MPLDLLVFILPKPGKEKRVAELLTTHTENVRAEEPYTLSYHTYKCQGEEGSTVDYVVYARPVETRARLLLALS